MGSQYPYRPGTSVIEATLRLREYDLQQIDSEFESLKEKVRKRREELGNMEIIVAEPTELLNMALIGFLA